MKTYIMIIKDGYNAINRFRVTEDQIKVIKALANIDGVFYNDMTIDFILEDDTQITDLTK